jgi:tRNA(Met) cytidine acetyltransferase
MCPTESQLQWHSLSAFQHWWQNRLQAGYHRQLLVITGDAKWQTKPLATLLAHYSTSHLMVFSENIAHPSTQPQANYKALLGNEFACVIYDANQQCDASSLLAVSGLVKRNGIMVLLCPPLNRWYSALSEPFRQHFSHAQYPTLSYFLKRLTQAFQQDQQVCLLSETEFIGALPDLAAPPSQPVQDCLTEQQLNAVEQIEQVVTGHRKRPLVITADRGRGKSSALGIAASRLAKQGKNLVITAPRKQHTQQVFNQFKRLLGDGYSLYQERLQFLPLDQLLQTKAEADLVMVDEAASMPTYLLQKLADQCSRLVFSSTVEGYEGSGRGFALRFQPYLQRSQPGMRALHLTQPIRWSEDDPLEAFWHRVMLMQETESPAITHTIHKQEITESASYHQLSGKQLIDKPNWLAQAFQLLLSAHYQTSPNDLMRLLDSPTQTLHLLIYQQQVLSVALTDQEGAPWLDDLAEEISLGQRRVQGHLVAQNLAMETGDPAWANYGYTRILRIATRSEWQNRGLASRLVKQLRKQSDSDLLATSFGCTFALFKFWQRNQFIPLCLSRIADKSSSEFSLIMLQPPASSYPNIQAPLLECAATMASQLLETQQARRQQLPIDLLCALLRYGNYPVLSQTQRQQLHSYVKGNKPFHYAELAIRALVVERIKDVKDPLLIALFIRQITHHQALRQFSLQTNKNIQDRVKNAVTDLFQSY